MALRMINLHTVNTFVWSKDPGKGTEDETKFEYRPLDAYEQAYLQDRLSTIESMPVMREGMDPAELMKQVKTRTEVHKVAIDAVRIACTGFENLQDEAGNLQEYQTEHANIGGRAKNLLKLDILRALPVAMLLEFYMAIMASAVVAPSTEKNSVQG